MCLAAVPVNTVRFYLFPKPTFDDMVMPSGSHSPRPFPPAPDSWQQEETSPVITILMDVVYFGIMVLAFSSFLWLRPLLDLLGSMIRILRLMLLDRLRRGPPISQTGELSHHDAPRPLRPREIHQGADGRPETGQGILRALPERSGTRPRSKAGVTCSRQISNSR
jgi:hypothetical protein